MTFEEVLRFFDLTPLDFKMIIVMMIIFYLFYRLSTVYFFAPILNIVEAKEYLTAGVLEESARLRKKADEIFKECSEEELRCRIKAVEEKIKMLSEVKEKASLNIKKAQEEAENILAEGREALKKEAEEVKQKLNKDISNIAAEAFSKLGSYSLN
ncbi:MAG: hypothetical protein D6780_03015 [Candidatus Dadabacteria bacterium]|nr:MAG: hypothetical protein D6780_03015 [Candidatus Dadabacteria bacterium]